MMRFEIHREARAEVDAAATYYNELQPGLGTEFLRELQDTFNNALERPKSGHLFSRTKHRFMLVNRFPYVVYYLELEDSVWIAAISHGARRPGYWKKRRP